MSFNFSQAPEYKLNSNLIKEIIHLYGVTVKFIRVDKVNHDKTIFKDFSHLESLESYDIEVLPEMSESFDMQNSPLQDFGLLNFDNAELFVHKSAFDNICKYNQIVGNLIVFPSNKVMEITFAEEQVPGINNLYTFGDTKTCYKLTCKPYEFKKTDEIQHVDLKNQPIDDPIKEYDALDEYFNELLKDSQERAHEAEVQQTVQTASGEKVPVIDKTKQDIWGQGF